MIRERLRTLLVRGMVAGVVAGVFGAVFAYLVGESRVDAAIGFEASMPGHDEVELVSRGVQGTVGLLVAVAAYGTAIGGLFALVFAVSLGRIGGATAAQIRAATIAAMTFVVVVAMPFLKYPANPPSVGQPETIGERTALYFAFVAVSIAACVLAAYLRARLLRPLGTFHATVLAGLGYVVLIAVAAWLMPGIDEVPRQFPASLLWAFRLSSLGTQLVLWGSLGLTFGALAKPVVDAQRRDSPRLAPRSWRQKRFGGTRGNVSASTGC